MKKISTTIKKVKIDEHIKQNKTNSSSTARKRGRPRKNTEHVSISPEADAGRGAPSSLSFNQSVEENIGAIEQQTAIEPIYDTTEEAKGFLRAPFDIAAGLTGIKNLALYPSQLDALAPSFKVVYDKRIAPKLGEDADLIAFAIVASGIVFEKVQVYRDEHKKHEPIEQVEEYQAPTIPTQSM